MNKALLITLITFIISTTFFVFQHNSEKTELQMSNSETVGNNWPPIKDRPTIRAFEGCRNIQCNQMCKEGDSLCYIASAMYTSCYSTDTYCVKYEDYWKVKFAEDKMPDDWYQCQDNCEFEESQDLGSYYPRINCIVGCGYKQ